MRRPSCLIVPCLFAGFLIAGCGGEMPVAVEGEAKSTWIELGGERQQVSYVVENGQAMMEGDITLGDAEALELGRGIDSAALRNVAWLWPSCVVPYVIDPSAGVKRTTILNAIDHWQRQTPIRFVARTTQAGYVRFMATEPACYSYIGRTGGAQPIMIGNGCGLGQTIHEIGHAVGLFHEQSRFDRDSYVRVLWQNIQTGKEGNFQKYSTTMGRDIGAYDLKSIMHYGPYFFSKNGQPTLVPVNATAIIGNATTALSAGDVYGAKALYKGRCQ